MTRRAEFVLMGLVLAGYTGFALLLNFGDFAVGAGYGMVVAFFISALLAS